jgi:Tol biopolymer transport system component
LNSRFLTFWSNEGRDYLDKLSVYDVETASLKEISFQSQRPQFPAISPNGEQIAFLNYDFEADITGFPVQNTEIKSGLELMNVDGTNAHQLVSGEIKNVTWRPDGTRIFYEKEITEVDPSTDTLTVISPSQIYSFDLASGLETLLTPSSTEIFLFDISPDGKFMTYGANTGIYLISSEGGASVKLPSQDPGIWSPDSQYKAYGFGTSEPESDGIYIMDIQGRGQVMVYHDIQVIDIYAWLP